MTTEVETSELFQTTRATSTCSVTNCLSCPLKNECEQCRPHYKLVNKKCYSTQCSMYGECQYCTEFDCVHCQKGYKVEYGYCEISDNIMRLEILFGVVLPLIITVALIILILMIRSRRKRIALKKVVSANMINEKRPANGQYIIINTTNINNNGTINITNTHASEGSFTSPQSSKLNEKLEKDKASVNSNSCVGCNSKNIYSFSPCGCGLCKEHSANNSAITCPIHGVAVSDNLIIKKETKTLVRVKSEDKINQSEKVKMCPVCKIAQGTMSFNCGCPVLLCDKCFHDNVFVFKFKRCPGCNKPYFFTPNKNIK